MSATDNDKQALTAPQMLRVIRESWKFLVIATISAGLIALVIGLVMTPVYRATTLLVPDEGNNRGGLLDSAMGQLGGIAAIAGLGIGGNLQGPTNEALAVLQSRQLIQEFIERKNLLPKIFKEKWDEKTNAFKPSSLSKVTIGKGYKRFIADILDVSQDRKSNLVTLSISWTDRNEATEWANELVAAVNQRMRERAISQADQTLEYLQQEFKHADTVEVRQALSSMMESQLKTKALASVRKQYAFRVIDQAVAPDKDVVLRPHKGLYTAVGLALGLFVGIAIIFLRVRGEEQRHPGA